jgi:hypothetical protein
MPSGPNPNSAGGFYWDQAVVFAPDVRWENVSPPSFWEGPVFEIIPNLATALGRMTHTADIGANRRDGNESMQPAADSSCEVPGGSFHAPPQNARRQLATLPRFGSRTGDCG